MGWRRAVSRDAAEAAQWSRRAKDLLPALVGLLVRDWGARRVVLFGSLATGGFRASSDIDLVVEGLAPATFFHACAAVDRLAGDLLVDLVPLESARPFVHDVLARQECEVLYDGRPAK